jgi:hypothetical protein
VTGTHQKTQRGKVREAVLIVVANPLGGGRQMPGVEIVQ